MSNTYCAKKFGHDVHAHMANQQARTAVNPIYHPLTESKYTSSPSNTATFPSLKDKILGSLVMRVLKV